MKNLTERIINAWLKGLEKRAGWSKEEIQEMRDAATKQFQLDKEIKRG